MQSNKSNSKIINFIHNQLEEFHKSGFKIIGFEGSSGSGKTSLIEVLYKKYPVYTIIRMDDFLYPFSERLKHLVEIKDKVIPYKKYWYDSYKILNFIKNHKTSQLIIVEGLFIKWVIGDLIDKTIRIELENDLLEERRDKKIHKLYSSSGAKKMKLFYKLCDQAWDNYKISYPPDISIAIHSSS